jgi:hypothetical protein
VVATCFKRFYSFSYSFFLSRECLINLTLIHALIPLSSHSHPSFLLLPFAFILLSFCFLFVFCLFLLSVSVRSLFAFCFRSLFVCFLFALYFFFCLLSVYFRFLFTFGLLSSCFPFLFASPLTLHLYTFTSQREELIESVLQGKARGQRTLITYTIETIKEMHAEILNAERDLATIQKSGRKRTRKRGASMGDDDELPYEAEEAPVNDEGGDF